MTLQETTSLYDQLLESNRTRSAGGEPEVMANVRSSALARFRELGFPTGKNEDWRFTSLTPYLTDAGFSMERMAPDEDSILQAITDTMIPGLETYQIVLVNGQIRTDLSVLPDQSLMTVQPVSTAITSGAFLAYLHENTFTGSEGLLALNTASFAHGSFIEVKQGAVIDKPLRVLHVFGAAENVFFQPRHLWVVNRHARLTLLEQSVVIKDRSTVALVNEVSRIAVKEEAHLTHYKIQQNQVGERWLHYNRVSQQRSSRYDNFTFSLPGADLIRNNLEMALDDTGTESHLYGLYLVGKDQLTDNHTAIAHQHPSCESNELYKGVIAGNGKAVFNGKVLVSRDAQQTNAYQQNNNLLLSGQARVYAKPQLEIYADDVKCSHGCTIGQFNPESLFYLRSRGIGEETAKNLLVEAFAYDITDKIEDMPIKAHMQRLIHHSMTTAMSGL